MNKAALLKSMKALDKKSKKMNKREKAKKKLTEKEQAGLSLIIAARAISNAVTHLQCLPEEYDVTEVSSDYEDLGTQELTRKVEAMWNRSLNGWGITSEWEPMLDIKDIIHEHGELLIEEEGNNRDWEELSKLAEEQGGNTHA